MISLFVSKYCKPAFLRSHKCKPFLNTKGVVLNPILYGGGSKRPPPADYRTLILGECPKWADFS